MGARLEIRQRPILTSYDVRRAVSAARSRDSEGLNPSVLEAEISPHRAKLVAKLRYLQHTPTGIETVPVTAELNASGVDLSFSDRWLKANITADDRSFSYGLIVREDDQGISYAVTQIDGMVMPVSDHPSLYTDYRFRRLLTFPRQVTPEDLMGNYHHQETLFLNQEMTAAILETTGAPLFAPEPNE